MDSPNLQPSPETSIGRRDPSLDFLRFIAITLVLICHSVPVPQTAPAWIRLPLEFVQRGGWSGVDLFFVLSGFLIARLLFQEHQRRGFH